MVLTATHERALEIVPLDVLRQYSVDVPADAGQDTIRRAVTGHEDFARATGGAPVERLIIVPGRIANVLTSSLP